MPHINLLPWREGMRRQRNKEFSISCFVFAAIMFLAIGGVHYFFQEEIGLQEKRNKYITDHILELDKKIDSIKTLDAEREALLARMEIIEQLQASRPEIVHLFDALVDTLPEGIFYKGVVQKGRSLTVVGVAQSNARVSSLMRNLGESEWIRDPVLLYIERRQKTNDEQILRLSDFSLKASQRKPKSDKPEEGAGEDSS